MKSIILTGGLCLSMLAFRANSQPINKDIAITESKQEKKMKEYVLLIRLPIGYGTEQAQQVRDKWNVLLDKWKTDNVFVTSFVFPGESYVVSSASKEATKESLVTNGRIMISSIIIKAASFEDAIAEAKRCPILEQDGNVEVRETLPRPPANNTPPPIQNR